MASVLDAIMIIVKDRTFLRPIRSPRGPKNMPPTGRTRKATANVAREESTWAVPLPDGKNTLPMVTAR